MKTTLPKESDVQRKWYIVDAAGKPLGRLSVKIANLLRGRSKPIFTPHLDTGDFVVVTNVYGAVTSTPAGSTRRRAAAGLGPAAHTTISGCVASTPNRAASTASYGPCGRMK